MTLDERDTRRPNRIALGALGVVLLGVVVVVSFFAALIMGLGTCGGDAGEAYASPGSTADRFCNSAVGSVVILGTFVVPPLVSAVLGVAGVVRRSWGWAAASGWLPGGLAFLTVAVVSGLPGA